VLGAADAVDADSRYPVPPELSPEEAARRRDANRRLGLVIAAVCLLLAVAAAVVLLTLDPGDESAGGLPRRAALVEHGRAAPVRGL